MVMIQDHIQAIYSALNLGGGLRFFPIASSSTLPSTAPKLTVIRNGSKRFINPGQVTITFHISFNAYAIHVEWTQTHYLNINFFSYITSISIDTGGFPEQCTIRFYRTFTYKQGYPRYWGSNQEKKKEFAAYTTHWEQSSLVNHPLWLSDSDSDRFDLDDIKKLYNEDYVYYLEVSVYGKTYTTKIEHNTDPNSWIEYTEHGEIGHKITDECDRTLVIRNWSVT